MKCLPHELMHDINYPCRIVRQHKGKNEEAGKIKTLKNNTAPLVV